MNGGADMELKNKYCTALHIAAARNHLDVVQCMVSKGADVAKLTEEERARLFDLAISRAQLKSVKYLFLIGCKPSKEENLPIVQDFCQNMADIEIPYKPGFHGIHELAKLGANFINILQAAFAPVDLC